MTSSTGPQPVSRDSPSAFATPHAERSRRYLERIVAGSGTFSGDDSPQRSTGGIAGSPITHVEMLPTAIGRSAPWPDWAPPTLIARLAARGIAAPWAHQAQA